MTHVTEIPTPALVVDRVQLVRNIETMAHALEPGVGLRPHVKSHKCVEIAAAQLAAGAIGMTTATVWEALAMAETGVPDILIANQVIGVGKLEVLASAARQAAVTVAVDDRRNAEDLGRLAQAAGVELGVLIEIDVGMGRCGVRSIAEGVELARLVEVMPDLRFRGVMGYEGHCSLEPDRAARERCAVAAQDHLLEFAAATEAAGLPVEIVSGGGTGTYDMTGRRSGYTELQAGSYVFSDSTYEGVVGAFGPALAVHATVVHSDLDQIVVDCGEKTVGQIDPPRLLDWDAETRFVSEEHTQFRLRDGRRLDAGDRVRVLPGHCCATVNLHPSYHVVEGTSVVDEWAIVTRGPGRPAAFGDGIGGAVSRR